MSEISKGAVQIAVETTRDFRAFLSRLFGPATDVAAETLQDQFKYWRFKNSMRIADKIESLHRARGIASEDIRSIPFGDAYKALSAASEEEEDSVQDLWAALLANASDPSGDASIQKVHIDLLKSITRVEAAILQALPATYTYGQRITEREVDLLTAFSDAELEMATENLVRLRCLAMVSHIHGGNISFPPLRTSTASDADRWLRDAPKQINGMFEEVGREIANMGGATPRTFSRDTIFRYTLTALGRNLMKACEVT